MKELTPEELALIASSNAKNKSANPASPPVYVVTGHPPSPGPGFPITFSPSPSPITGGPGGGPGGPGSVRPGPSGPPIIGAPGGGTNITPNGWSYGYKLNLSSQQIETTNHIIDYGLSHGYSKADAKIAVDMAFNESAISRVETNPSNPHVTGLYQYNSAMWKDLGHADEKLGINNDSDQIKAFYEDISKYTTRYSSGQRAGTIPSSLSFSDYMEVKHHLGDSSKEWNSPVVDAYNQKNIALGFQIFGQTVA